MKNEELLADKLALEIGLLTPEAFEARLYRELESGPAPTQILWRFYAAVKI